MHVGCKIYDLHALVHVHIHMHIAKVCLIVFAFQKQVHHWHGTIRHNSSLIKQTYLSWLIVCWVVPNGHSTQYYRRTTEHEIKNDTIMHQSMMGIYWRFYKYGLTMQYEVIKSLSMAMSSVNPHIIHHQVSNRGVVGYNINRCITAIMASKADHWKKHTGGGWEINMQQP